MREDLRNDVDYIGLRQPRVRGAEYDEFIDEFMQVDLRSYINTKINITRQENMENMELKLKLFVAFIVALSFFGVPLTLKKNRFCHF